MPYDEGLALRMREVMDQGPAYTEKKMFDGLSFMINGNMSVGISTHGFIVSVGKENDEAALSQPHTHPSDFTGRIMKGWIIVSDHPDIRPPSLDIIYTNPMSVLAASPTIAQAIRDFLDVIAASRSANTTRSYQNALSNFATLLEANELPPDQTPAAELPASAISWFLKGLKEYAPASEQMYLVAVSRFYQYLVAEELNDVNLERLRLLVKTRARKPGKRLPQFPRDDIEKLIGYAAALHQRPAENDAHTLVNYRDRAFILTLADTGLRVSEAVNLRRGDMDWKEFRALIIGKGDQEAVVRFSTRAIEAINPYIRMRAELGYIFSGPISSMPLFARHDKGAGKKVKPITTATGRNIIKQRLLECLGPDSLGAITPHSFRHFFVTTVLRASGGNLKLAQELARHKNIQVTQRYAHLSNDELDRSYHDIFEN